MGRGGWDPLCGTDEHSLSLSFYVPQSLSFSLPLFLPLSPSTFVPAVI